MSSIIGMELSESYVKLVEIKPRGEYPELLNYSMIEFDTAEERSAKIRRVLKERGFRSKVVHLASSDVMSVHKLMELPPMSDKEMKIVVSRELKYEIADDFSMGYQTVEGGVMVVAVPNKSIEDDLSLIENAGLKCPVFVTIPLALQNLLELKGETMSGTSVLAHLGKGNCYIAIGSRDKLFFATRFPIQMEGDKDTERLVSRVAKSFLFVKEHLQMEVNSVILSGGDELSVLAEALEEELKIAVEVFDPMGSLDITRLGEEAQTFHSLIPSFAVPIGLALKNPKNFQINLLSTPKGVALGGVWGGVRRKVTLAAGISFIILMIFVSVKLSKSKEQYQTNLANLESSISESQLLLKKHDEIERERELYKTRAGFLQVLKERSILWSKTLEELQALVPDEIALRSLNVERVKDGWQVNIKGKITTSDFFTAIAVYDRLSRALKESPFFTNVSPQLSIGESREFEITCELKWKPLIVESEQESSP